MDSFWIYSLAATGFSVAFLHAAIPTHWLPFVAVGRARGWSARRTLAAVALAGGGHIIATTVLGVGFAVFGFELNERFGHAFHWVVAGILVSLGAWLAFRAPHGRSCDHCHGDSATASRATSDRVALWGLFLTLTLSPCKLFLPVYLTAVPYGWSGVAGLSVVLAIATLGSMVGLAWATLRGLARLRWSWLEPTNRRLAGGLLCLLSVIVVAAH